MSDYWQDDEAKWQKAYLVGPTAIEIGDWQFDESSTQLLMQVRVQGGTPTLKAPLGAVTIGVRLGQLLRLGVVTGNSPLVERERNG